MMKEKRGQAEVITTVLLILVALAAVAFVSVFIINMVRNNLSDTGCFKTTGGLSISLEEGFSFSDSQNVSISVERGQGSFNLTGIGVIVSKGSSSKTYEIFPG